MQLHLHPIFFALMMANGPSECHDAFVIFVGISFKGDNGRDLLHFAAKLQRNVRELPKAVLAPHDDGACSHLVAMKLPSLALASTSGRMVDLATLSGITVVYIYLRTGRPDQELPKDWDAILGACGCTPQSRAFRDHHQELKALVVASLFGLSTQDSSSQQEAVERLHLPFELLSDKTLAFARALRLLTLVVDGMTLLRRVTLIMLGCTIEKVFYPVFPPKRNVEDVIEWLK